MLNPVRAGMVRSAREWRWSSYRATAGQVEVPTFLEVVRGGKYTDKYVPASCAHAYSLPPGMQRESSDPARLISAIVILFPIHALGSVTKDWRSTPARGSKK